MNSKSYETLSDMLTPDFDEFPFDEIPVIDDLDETED